MSIRVLLCLCLLMLLRIAPAATLSDPTQPSGASHRDAPSGGQGWQLNATHITPTKRLAVINGIQVAEGDLIGAARVVRVGHAQVKLEAQGEIVTLRLMPAEVKKIR